MGPMETPLFTSLHETPGTNARRVGVLTQDANREAAKLGWGLGWVVVFSGIGGKGDGGVEGGRELREGQRERLCERRTASNSQCVTETIPLSRKPVKLHYIL